MCIQIIVISAVLTKYHETTEKDLLLLGEIYKGFRNLMTTKAKT